MKQSLPQPDLRLALLEYILMSVILLLYLIQPILTSVLFPQLRSNLFPSARGGGDDKSNGTKNALTLQPPMSHPSEDFLLCPHPMWGKTQRGLNLRPLWLRDFTTFARVSLLVAVASLLNSTVPKVK